MIRLQPSRLEKGQQVLCRLRALRARCFSDMLAWLESSMNLSDSGFTLAEMNFRDIGGLSAGRGERIASGVLYRCQAPSRLPPMHRAEVLALGAKMVCDLRSSGERERDTHGWEAGVDVVELDLFNDFGDPARPGFSMLRADPTAAGARTAMQATYAGMPALIQRHLARIVQGMISGATPVIVHCAAGKDRTGVLVALLLLFAGVPHDAVLEDYMLSACYGRMRRAEMRNGADLAAAYGFSIDPRAVDVMTGVEPGFLAAALEAVAVGWGSEQAYFDAADLKTADQRALRAILTEHSPTQPVRAYHDRATRVCRGTSPGSGSGLG